MDTFERKYAAYRKAHGMPERNTCECGRPIHDQGTVCRRCWMPVETGLGDAPALLEEIETTRTRQARTGGSSGGRKSAETSLPWLEAASRADRTLRDALETWAQLVADDLGVAVDYHRHAVEASRFLLTRSTWLRHHETGPQARRSITVAVGQARTVVDRSPDLLYIGPCDTTGEHHTDFEPELRGPCKTDLYARLDKAEVTCPRCQLVWNVQDRREFLLATAGEQLVTATDLSRFLTAYGDPLTPERVRQWSSRGQLAQHGTNPAGLPLYKVDEAITVLSRMTERKAAS